MRSHGRDSFNSGQDLKHNLSKVSALCGKAPVGCRGSFQLRGFLYGKLLYLMLMFSAISEFEVNLRPFCRSPFLFFSRLIGGMMQ